MSDDNAVRVVRMRIKEVDDSGDQQKIKATGLTDDEYEDVVVVQGFGDNANPPAGAEGWGLVFGNSDRVIGFNFETPGARPSNAASGGRKITAGGISITFAGGKYMISGNVEITGTLKVNGVDVGDTHKHSGVTAGAAQSGPPVP